MIFLKNKMILFEAILIAVIIGSSGLYVADFNNSHFEPIKNMDLNNINQWNHGKRLEVTESNGIMKITSISIIMLIKTINNVISTKIVSSIFPIYLTG